MCVYDVYCMCMHVHVCSLWVHEVWMYGFCIVWVCVFLHVKDDNLCVNFIYVELQMKEWITDEIETLTCISKNVYW